MSRVHVYFNRKFPWLQVRNVTRRPVTPSPAIVAQVLRAISREMFAGGPFPANEAEWAIEEIASRLRCGEDQVREVALAEGLMGGLTL